MSAVPAQGLRARWSALAPRERRLVTIAALVIGLGLLWTVLLEPAWRARQRLQTELPALRAQVAQVDALVSESRRMGDAGGVVLPLPAVRDELERSVAAAGLREGLKQLEVRGERIEMRFVDVSFPAWLIWLDAAQRSLRLRIVQASVARPAGAEAPPAPPVLSAGTAAGAPARGPGPGTGRVTASVAFEVAGRGGQPGGGAAPSGGAR